MRSTSTGFVSRGSPGWRRSLNDQWRRYSRNRLAVVGGAIVIALSATAVIGPALLPLDPTSQTAVPLSPPSLDHPFGVDDLGRDILARIVAGAGLSLLEGVAVALTTMVIGVPIGALAAYYRRLDNLIMRPNDVLIAIPTLLLALALVPVLGASLIGAILAVSFSLVPGSIVFARSVVLSIVPREYVVAARSIGARDARIIVRHVIPNALSVLIVSAAIRVGLGILIVSGLSFLGLGAQPPQPEWGAMLASGRAYLYSAPHVAMFPAFALALTIFGFNLLGDGLRDVLDPHTRGT
jgi:peptide/nickel transport system permease protein